MSLNIIEARNFWEIREDKQWITWLSWLCYIPHKMNDGCLNSACLWCTLDQRWGRSWTLGELFYNHPLGTVTSSSRISTDHSQRLEATAHRRQLAREKPLQENSFRRSRDSLPCPQEKEGYGGEQKKNKLGGTEEQRQGLKLVLNPFHVCFLYNCRWSVRKANTQVQGQEHKGQLWQCSELFEFPITAHYVRRTCPHGLTWPVIPPKSFQIHLFLLISNLKN